MKLTYRKHHREDAEAHLFIDPACPSGACTIELTGAASMTQEELDHLGAMFAAAPELLAACIACLDRDDVADCELGDMLREAIAQARGA